MCAQCWAHSLILRMCVVRICHLMFAHLFCGSLHLCCICIESTWPCHMCWLLVGRLLAKCLQGGGLLARGQVIMLRLPFTFIGTWIQISGIQIGCVVCLPSLVLFAFVVFLALLASVIYPQHPSIHDDILRYYILADAKHIGMENFVQLYIQCHLCTIILSTFALVLF